MVAPDARRVQRYVFAIKLAPSYAALFRARFPAFNAANGHEQVAPATGERPRCKRWREVQFNNLPAKGKEEVIETHDHHEPRVFHCRLTVSSRLILTLTIRVPICVFIS